MKQRNIIIFGDSYSTFEGHIPEGYATYYTEKGREETDVRKVSETWWHRVVTETDSNLVLNNSWSGSTIGYMGYNSTDCSETSSFIFRLKKLIGEGFFEKNKIDTVLVFGGTNDNWAGVPMGEVKFEGWKKNELFTVLPAVCYFFKLLKDTLPDAEIYFIVNTEFKDEFYDGIDKICEEYSLTKVAFKNIDKKCGHPTVKGMADIKNGVIKALNKQ